MTNEQTTTMIEYRAACDAHGEFYDNVRRPANAAHLSGEMSADDYFAVRAEENKLLAEVDRLYAIVSEYPDEDEEIEGDEVNQLELI